MTQLMLDSCELAYLANLLSAQVILGTDNAQLFPEDEKIRAAFLEKGFKSLQEHGWLVKDEKGKFDFPIPQLMLVIATMANPEQIVVTSSYVSPREKQVVTHYIAPELIVEQVFSTDGKYLLTILPSQELVMERISQFLNLTVSHDEHAIIMDGEKFDLVGEALSKQQFEKAKLLIEQATISQTNGYNVFDILSKTTASAKVEVGDTRLNQLISSHDLTFFTSNNSLWLCSVNELEKKVQLQPANIELFTYLLKSYLQNRSENVLAI